MASAAVPPRIMGIGPVPSTRKLMERLGFKIGDFDLIELNEAFASQGLACLRQLGVADDADYVNPHGGAIALGHPLGMSGARLALTAVHGLENARRQARARHHVRRRRPGRVAGAGTGLSVRTRRDHGEKPTVPMSPGYVPFHPIRQSRSSSRRRARSTRIATCSGRRANFPTRRSANTRRATRRRRNCSRCATSSASTRTSSCRRPATARTTGRWSMRSMPSNGRAKGVAFVGEEVTDARAEMDGSGRRARRAL